MNKIILIGLIMIVLLSGCTDNEKMIMICEKACHVSAFNQINETHIECLCADSLDWYICSFEGECANQNLKTTTTTIEETYELFNCTDRYVCDDGYKFEYSFVDNTTRGFGICDMVLWKVMYEDKIQYIATNETLMICASECSCEVIK